MEHAEFRRLFGANPKRTEPEVLEHRASCAECAKYASDMQRIDQMVFGALEVPAPAPGLKPWELEQKRPSPIRWYALAASVLVALTVAGGTWLHVRRVRAALSRAYSVDGLRPGALHRAGVLRRHDPDRI